MWQNTLYNNVAAKFKCRRRDELKCFLCSLQDHFHAANLEGQIILSRCPWLSLPAVSVINVAHSYSVENRRRYYSWCRLLGTYSKVHILGNSPFFIPTNDIWFCIWTNQKTESSKRTNQIDSQTLMNLDKLYLRSFWHTAVGRHLDGAVSGTVGGARSTRGVNGGKHRFEYFCRISFWQMVWDYPLSFSLERGETHSYLHHLNIYFASPAFQSLISLSLWFRLELPTWVSNCKSSL